MMRPTEGEILVDGHPWRRDDLYRIGSLIEEAPLYPNLTARENLRVRTTMLGLPEERIGEVLETVGLRMRQEARGPLLHGHEAAAGDRARVAR